MQAMRNCAFHYSGVAKFTFDTRRESQHNTSLLYDMATKSPTIKDQLFPNIAFECSADNPRLQVADLFAREVMKALDNLVAPIKREPRKSWMALYKTGRFHAEVIGVSWFESLQQQMPMLESDTGLSRDGYLRWLSENKRQHNTTNLFLYMERVGK